MGLYLNLPFSLSTSAVSVFPSRIAKSSAVSPRHINFYNTHVRFTTKYLAKNSLDRK